MDNYTQLGLAGLTLGILFFIVRYFVTAMNKKDEQLNSLTQKFVQLTEDNISSHNKLSIALDTNTKSNQVIAEATRSGNDKLTALMMKVIRSNGHKTRKDDK